MYTEPEIEKAGVATIFKGLFSVAQSRHSPMIVIPCDFNPFAPSELTESDF